MPQILKNKNLEITIDLPQEGYGLARFDQTGKIVSVKFYGIQLAGIERTDVEDKNLLGRGFYNEFGIDTALGFEEAELEGWFQKIGVGLLKKDSHLYDFMRPYVVKPAEFQTTLEENKITITCKSVLESGYAYLLKKEIELFEDSFRINYYLENTGEKDIRTDEYVHNFIAVHNDLIGSNYILNFPFQLYPELFAEAVNPESIIETGVNTIKFNATPEEEYYFSNLAGGEMVDVGWELEHLTTKIKISESTSFKSDKVNLWGWRHVISPEVFIKIALRPSESTAWARTFSMSKTT